MRVGLVRWLLFGLVAVLLGGCVGPTPTVGTYREHAAGALGQVGEAMAAVELFAENAAADNLVTPYATILAREQEERAVYAETAFAGRQPPAGQDDARERVLDLLADGVDLAERARILADRGDLEGLAGLMSRAGQLQEQLRSLEEEFRQPDPDGGGA